MSDPVAVTTITRINHAEAMRLTSVENERFGHALRALDTDDWTKPTACSRWDVHAVASHVTGSARAQASPLEFIRQVRAGRPVRKDLGLEYWWDGMNEIQVQERAGASPQALVAEWAQSSERALRARTKLPRIVSRLPLLNLPEPVGRQPVGYLFDVGFTRDTWIHRIDIARATGAHFDADSTHDGRLVADIVAEWATTHDAQFDLNLTGPAGGRYARGDGAESVDLDAIDFCLILAVHADGDSDLLRHRLPM